jgi:ABC-type Fe3+-citrate transport system substrate-binding protein
MKQKELDSKISSFFCMVSDAIDGENNITMADIKEYSKELFAEEFEISEAIQSLKNNLNLSDLDKGNPKNQSDLFLANIEERYFSYLVKCDGYQRMFVDFACADNAYLNIESMLLAQKKPFVMTMIAFSKEAQKVIQHTIIEESFLN